MLKMREVEYINLVQQITQSKVVSSVLLRSINKSVLMILFLLKNMFRDNWGRKWCHLVAMDATYFQNPSVQYEMKYVNRELIKAYTCFRPRKAATTHDGLFGIATGNWGCGAFNGDKELKGRYSLIVTMFSSLLY